MEQNINEKRRLRAVIGGVFFKNASLSGNTTDSSLDELEALLETAGGEALARFLQNRESPDIHSYIGEGKAKEIADMAKDLGADAILFDDELSPSHIRNLERMTGLQIIDRSALILDIFASRARTAEGKLQVELAQYKYLLPRLSGKGIAMSRQAASGGSSPIGTRGPGETKLETDRRHIRERITRLEKELKDVRRTRAEQRRKREKAGISLVSLVGYTNSGKSTILNALTDAGIEANNRLFDTLDPTTRHCRINDTLEVLMTDTVGFIRKLPHHLVEAFKATLEELALSDLILHVIDASNPAWHEQAEVTEALADELCGSAIPRLRVFNKLDAAEAAELPTGEGMVRVSARTGENIDGLKDAIAHELDRGRRRVRIVLPYEQSALLDVLYKKASVLQTEYGEEGIMVDAVCDAVIYGTLRDFAVREEFI